MHEMSMKRPGSASATGSNRSPEIMPLQPFERHTGNRYVWKRPSFCTKNVTERSPENPPAVELQNSSASFSDVCQAPRIYRLRTPLAGYQVSGPYSCGSSRSGKTLSAPDRSSGVGRIQLPPVPAVCAEVVHRPGIGTVRNGVGPDVVEPSDDNRVVVGEGRARVEDLLCRARHVAVDPAVVHGVVVAGNAVEAAKGGIEEADAVAGVIDERGPVLGRAERRPRREEAAAILGDLANRRTRVRRVAVVGKSR
jgi:hypothetical protein